MSRNAFLALCVAILIPLVSYLLVRQLSDGAVVIPRHYLLDSVVTRIDHGKQVDDSIWHVTKNISLTNQLGKQVSLYDVPGKPIVADFFFTSCASICPKMTANMARLQRSFIRGGDTRQKIDSSVVQFMSFSIDPDRDSVPRLKAFADRFGADHDSWWFLTGPRDSIYRFAFEELRVDKFSMEPIDPNFIHTSRFVLLDRDYRVRGYYNGLDTVSLSALARDIGVLLLEKDPEHPGKLPFDPVLMGVIFLIAIVIVAVGISVLIARRKATGDRSPS